MPLVYRWLLTEVLCIQLLLAGSLLDLLKRAWSVVAVRLPKVHQHLSVVVLSILYGATPHVAQFHCLFLVVWVTRVLFIPKGGLNLGGADMTLT